MGTSHNVCSRFYIQMSSSRRPLRGLFTLSRKLISYSLAADRKLTLTCEWHTNSRLVGLLNFSSDQSFYTNTGQNLSPYSLFFSLWCFSSPPFCFFAHAQRLMNGQLKQIKFRCTERCGALLNMWWAAADVFVCGDVSAVCVRARVCLCVSLCARLKSKAAPCSVFFYIYFFFFHVNVPSLHACCTILRLGCYIVLAVVMVPSWLLPTGAKQPVPLN